LGLGAILDIELNCRGRLVVRGIAVFLAVSVAISIAFIVSYSLGGPEFLSLLASQEPEIHYARIEQYGWQSVLIGDDEYLGGLLLGWTRHPWVSSHQWSDTDHVVSRDGWIIVWSPGLPEMVSPETRNEMREALELLESGGLPAPSLGLRMKYLRTLVVKDFNEAWSGVSHSVKEVLHPSDQSARIISANRRFAIKKICHFPFDVIKVIVLFFWVHIWTLFPLPVSVIAMYIWLVLSSAGAILAFLWGL